MRLRLRLITEEFFELLEGALKPAMADKEWVDLECAKLDVGELIAGGRFHVDLAGVVDALADLDYVIEGTRQELGVDGAPIAAAVHAGMDALRLAADFDCLIDISVAREKGVLPLP
jgi:predicted HAD superfamily Cof-like phosphohydrolase